MASGDDPQMQEPLSEAQRTELQRLVEQRRAELAEKQRILENLRRGVVPTFATPTRTPPRGASIASPPRSFPEATASSVKASATAESLIDEILAKVEEATARAADTARSDVTRAGGAPSSTPQAGGPPGTPPTTARGGRATTTPSPPPQDRGRDSRFARAVKRVAGPLAEQRATVAINLTGVETLGKHVQCDLLPSTEPPEPPARSSSRPSAKPPTISTPIAAPGLGGVVSAEEVQKLQGVTVDAAAKGGVVGKQLTQQTQQSAAVRLVAPPPLTKDEAHRLLESPECASFVDMASKKVERALHEAELFNVFADYSKGYEGGEDNAAGARGKLRKLSSYVDDKWSQQRSIYSVRTHPSIGELFVVSYGPRAGASLSDPDGCALIWNVSLPTRAQTAFSNQSAVCAAIFDVYNPHLVIGGSYGGSVVLWDARAKTRPVQKTFLSQKSHAHPVYCLAMVGTEHAHNLISIDADGFVCVWSLAMLTTPTETVELRRSNGKELSCLCLDFEEGENNFFYGGAEDGSLFKAQLHGSKAGVLGTYPAHSAPTSAIDWHPLDQNRARDAADFSDLLLTSSLDWSVKLWSPKQHTTPIHSFDAAGDFVCDVEWHPTNPSIFASCQADGTLHTWDLGRDMEAPQVTQQVSEAAQSKLKWSPDGTRLIAGDATGEITLWGVSSEMSNPRQEDTTRFSDKVQELKMAASTTGGTAAMADIIGGGLSYSLETGRGGGGASRRGD